MLVKLYSVRDAKAEIFGPLFGGINDGQVLRSFEDGVNGGNKAWEAHPEDYSLWQVAEFDDVKGVVQPLQAPRHVALAVEYQKQAKVA